LAKGAFIDPPPSPDKFADTGLNLPKTRIFFDSNAATGLSHLSNTMGHVMRQKFLAHWKQLNNPLLKHVQMVIKADDSLRARMKHLSEYEIKGPLTRFDIPADKSVRFRPTAFLGNILSMTKAHFSAVQLGHYQRLVRGLDFNKPQIGNVFVGG
jgi:hypothetical protein